jgi:tetratricopeptide (TPR) repeat protein
MIRNSLLILFVVQLLLTGSSPPAKAQGRDLDPLDSIDYQWDLEQLVRAAERQQEEVRNNKSVEENSREGLKQQRQNEEFARRLEEDTRNKSFLETMKSGDIPFNGYLCIGFLAVLGIAVLLIAIPTWLRYGIRRLLGWASGGGFGRTGGKTQTPTAGRRRHTLQSSDNQYDAEWYTDRGEAYAWQGEHAHAIADYTKAIRLDPTLTLAFNNRGNAYFKLGEDDKAIADYTRAIDLDRTFAKAYSNRGAAYYGKGECDEAIADYTEARLTIS